MTDIVQSLVNCVNNIQPDQRELRRSTLRQECYVLWNILSFLRPELEPCGVCYGSNKRYKCKECVFILCETCGPRLKSNKCPHCARKNMFPKLEIPSDGSHDDNPFISPITPLLPLRERLLRPWNDNPFGPAVIYNPIYRRNPSFPISGGNCSFCGRDMTSLGETVCQCFIPGNTETSRRVRPRRSLTTELITWRNTANCVCTLRNVVGYRCPYGMNCQWIHGFSV